MGLPQFLHFTSWYSIEGLSFQWFYSLHDTVVFSLTQAEKVLQLTNVSFATDPQKRGQKRKERLLNEKEQFETNVTLWK